MCNGMAKTPSVVTRTQTVRDVPVELWRAFKATAAQRGETLRDALLRMLKFYVKGADRG